MIWLYILILIISSLVLVRAGTWAIGALIKIAQFLKWREFIVAFILMAFATSIPEFFVGITSAFHGHPELSFGNVIGSNIINLTLVVGICVLIARGLKIEGAILQRSAFYTAIIAFFPILLMLDGKISRVDGVVLLMALIFYFHQLLVEEERFTKVFADKFKLKWKELKVFLKDIGKFFTALALLLLAAEGVVWSASCLALAVGLPLVVIGAVIVAVGTNLPEIVFGVKAIAIERKEMVLGNLLGSVVANSTLVLGVTFLICPIEIPDFSPYFVGIIFTVLAALFFTILAKTGRQITKKEALFLLFLYVFFLVCEILIK